MNATAEARPGSTAEQAATAYRQWARDLFSRLATEAGAPHPTELARQLHLVRIFDEEGVPMMAGSDVSGSGWEIPGFALHQEFDQLNAAGLPPLRILQMTTINAAEFLGQADTMGTVEPGKDADLVLLRANPVDHAANLHNIAGVVRAGRYYSSQMLAATVETIAKTQAAV